MSTNDKKPPFNEARLYQKMEEADWDALVVVSMGNVSYLSNAPTARYWQQYRPHGPRLVMVVMARDSYPTIITGELERGTTSEAVWIEDLQCYPDYIQTPIEKLIDVLKKRGFGDKRIGLEMGMTGALRYMEFVQALPNATVEDCGPMMAEVRLEKTPEEQRRMKMAVDLMDEAFMEAFASVTVGSSELDLHKAIFACMAARGLTEGAGNILSGERAMVIHRYPSAEKKLESGDIIRTDYIGNYKGYNGNVSRVAVVGQPSKVQEEVYGHLLGVERDLADFARPGVRGAEIFSKARELFSQRGLEHNLPLLGHSIGVELHEDPMFVPSHDMVLVNNSVICLEPLILQQFHIQDQYLVTSQGAKLMSDGFNTDEIHIIN